MPTSPDPEQGFVHLHLHSEYSLLDGGNTVRALVARVKELGMDAVAITDHGNLHAAVEFHDHARREGIKPILGIEAYVAPSSRTERTRTESTFGGFHLVLLAETMVGWRNLMKLSSDAFINGFYYKPRTDKSMLESHCEGLIAINGHLGSSLAHHLELFERHGTEEHWEAALAEARWHRDVFGVNERGEPCFFVELQRHIAQQEAINPHLVRLAGEIGAPLVADNDAHFLLAGDHDVHDTLCCISMGKNKSDENRFHYPPELYVKSPGEMRETFPDQPEALDNTVRIAERCDVDLGSGENHAPVVKVVHPGKVPVYESGDRTEWFKEYCSRFELQPFDSTAAGGLSAEQLKESCDVALRDLCEAGLIWRYGPGGITDHIRARLDRELKILADKFISAYFLIVWDFVNWSRQRGIPTNARGSGVGTMVGYVLGLSNACPERYGLLFERFTDPDRAEYPDIDIDMCQDQRSAVIDHVKQKYGHVAQIITFGRLKARAAIKDVARVMGLEPAEGQRLANLIPNELNITFDDALVKEPRIREECEASPVVSRVIEQARALEDHARHSSIHAAGVVIATQALDTIVPLCKATGSDDIVTQWDGPTCERRGLLKMDFLGLRTLSTIERARQLILGALSEDEVWRAVGQEPPADGAQDDRPHPLDLDRLEFGDERVYRLFQRGDTDGVFQFESDGMRRLLIDMVPERLEDLIAANALFRPGPMDLIPDYVARKHGRQQVPRVHEIVDRLTEETCGIMVYQEQVMQVLHELGDIPLRKAYTIIKAISKKKHDVIDSARSEFTAGAGARGIDEVQSNELFDLILKFAGYGFNKSHSTGYAIVAYQTAYLKTYFPAFYMAALLTYESQAKKVEDWFGYMEGCRRVPWPDSTPEHPHVGIDVRPPDINRSEFDFAVVFDPEETPSTSTGHIRFGLGAIRGVGRDAIRSIIGERERSGPYRSLHDFCERVDHGRATSKTIELLVKAGAFDSVHGIEHRAAMLATIPEAVSAGKQLARDRAAGQEVLFGDPESIIADDSQSPAAMLQDVVPWNRMTTLNNEKDALGFHVSGHPLDEYSTILEEYCTSSATGLGELPQGSAAVLAGMISRVRPVTTKRGDRMAMLTIEDKSGSFDAVMFPEAFEEYGWMIEKDRTLLFTGAVDLARAQPNLQIECTYPITDASTHLATRIEVLFRDRPGETPEDRIETITEVARVLESASGQASPARGRSVETVLLVDVEDHRVALRTRSFRVVPTPELVSALQDRVGMGNVRVVGGFVPAVRQGRGNGRGRRQYAQSG
ncbi:MAG: DNA polymerase III subunit alpha [Planctomycetota bacterium]|nr:DNA polymerase III subunit alpha [Planctomycetota bacterium]